MESGPERVISILKEVIEQFFYAVPDGLGSEYSPIHTFGIAVMLEEGGVFEVGHFLAVDHSVKDVLCELSELDVPFRQFFPTWPI